MPIPLEDLAQELVVVDGSATPDQVRALLADRGPWVYVVVRLGRLGFAVVSPAELTAAVRELAAERSAAEVLRTPLARLGVLGRWPAEPFERTGLSTPRARYWLARHPEGRVVVLEDGAVVGVLVNRMRGGSPADVSWPVAAPDEAAGSAPPAPASPPAAPPPPAESAAPVPAAAPPPRAKLSVAPPRPPPGLPPGEVRWFNVEMEEHPESDPLLPGEVFTLAFDVDTQVRARSLVGGSPSAAFRYPWQEEMVTLTIQLSSDDFHVHTGPQQLRVPRAGRSKGRARFDVEPKREGDGVLSAVVLKDGNFIQLLTLRLRVGAAEEASAVPAPEVVGRSLGAAFEVEARDLCLLIDNAGPEYRLTLCGAVGATAALPITPAALDGLISEARRELLAVVNLADAAGGRPFQAGMEIPPELTREALVRLARTGFVLYQHLFFGPAADEQTRRVGERLRQMAREEVLRIQVVARYFPVPWGLLYLADSWEPERVDPELFLGLRHTIEQLPLQNGLHVTRHTIDTSAGLAVSLNLNGDIDARMGVPLVGRQLDYWEAVARGEKARVVVRRTGEEVVRALGDPDCRDQVVYFYCHAESLSLAEGGGPDASRLVLSGGQPLTLRDLGLFAPLHRLLSGAPLVFINACESAELSPLFYQGFVPYFMARGARGVIGTECATPALFATEWARAFFDRFLRGGALGEVFLELRRDFLREHGNPLGLLYALHCDADTRVVPALHVA